MLHMDSQRRNNSSRILFFVQEGWIENKKNLKLFLLEGKHTKESKYTAKNTGNKKVY